MDDSDWDTLYSSVHKLIPSFSVVGIKQENEDTAKKIQEYAGSQNHLDKLPDMVSQLEKVCNQACKELTEELNLIKESKG